MESTDLSDRAWGEDFVLAKGNSWFARSTALIEWEIRTSEHEKKTKYNISRSYVSIAKLISKNINCYSLPIYTQNSRLIGLISCLDCNATTHTTFTELLMPLPQAISEAGNVHSVWCETRWHGCCCSSEASPRIWSTRIWSTVEGLKPRSLSVFVKWVTTCIRACVLVHICIDAFNFTQRPRITASAWWSRQNMKDVIFQHFLLLLVDVVDVLF